MSEHPHRCRVCAANDHDAVVEDLAQGLWETRRHGMTDPLTWDEAGEYWRTTFREFAASAVTLLRR